MSLSLHVDMITTQNWDLVNLITSPSISPNFDVFSFFSIQYRGLKACGGTIFSTLLDITQNKPKKRHNKER